MKYQCKSCGYIYDEAVEKVSFDKLPEDWGCPECGAPKEAFEPIEEDLDELEEYYEDEEMNEDLEGDDLI